MAADAEGPLAGSARQARVETAKGLLAAGRWDAAATSFEALAREASAARELPLARECWSAAGDALRRDDRPARAARALQAALDLSERGDPRRGLAGAALASVLIEAGEAVPAEIQVREALAEARDPGLRIVLLDLLLGALVLLGRAPEGQGPFSELKGLVAALPPAAGALGRASLAFREAAFLRLAGDLDGAERLLTEVEAAMGGRKETAGAAAAAAGDLGELALAAGDGEAASEHLERSARGWTAAGRRAGLYRCEAGLLRAALARGETPLGRALDGPVTFAHERGMPLLEAELRLTRGLVRAAAGVRGAEDDLDRSVQLAERAHAALLEGRARLLRRRAGYLKDDLARTRDLLKTDAIWSAAAARPQAGEERGGPW